LEILIKRATSITYLSNLFYVEHLLKLGNNRLELRRLRADLLNSRINARANYIFVRTINAWNRLSDEMVNASRFFSSFFIF